MLELSVVIPTFNERENIPLLVETLEEILINIQFELIFVDDNSPDGSADVIRAIAINNTRVHCLQRIGRRGLSSACIEGMLASSAPCIAVIDADFQHDASILPQMLQTLRNENLDVVIGSRYIPGASLGNWNYLRKTISWIATKASQWLIRARVQDTMSGFFMLKRTFLHENVGSLSGKGFKILLDLFAAAKTPVRFKEIPYTFNTRQYGESKLGMTVIWEHFLLLADQTLGKLIPVRFIMFICVGAIGVLVHLFILKILLNKVELSFISSQMIATITAMTGNFFLNNWFTYLDQRLKGLRIIKGLFSFYLACSIGALVNFYVSSSLYDQGISWVVAGVLGLLIGAVWNYAITSSFTWSK